MQYQGFVVLAKAIECKNQKEFAERAGLFASQVNRHWYPDTRSRPTLPLLETAAARLNMPLWDIVRIIYGE